MATDNDNVIDIGGDKPERREGERKSEEKGKEAGAGGKKAQQKKTALYVVGFVFVAIAGYLAYRYYENNIAGQGAVAAGAAPASDSGGGGSAGGGGTPTPPEPLAPQVIDLVGGQSSITIHVLGNTSPVKAVKHVVAGHAAGPKVTTPTTFEKTAQTVTHLANGAAVQKAVATVTNLDVTRAIGAENVRAAEAASAHGHAPNPIVHLVPIKTLVPANADAAKAVGAANKVAPKPAPAPAPKTPPKTAPSAHTVRKPA